MNAHQRRKNRRKWKPGVKIVSLQCLPVQFVPLQIRQEYWDEYTAARVRLQTGTQTPEELAAEAMFKKH